MSKNKALSLNNILGSDPKLRFGGDLAKGKRKEKRFLAHNSLTHVVIKSPMAHGKRSMLHKAKQVEKIVRDQAAKQHIKVCDYANVGNHLHMLIQIKPSGKATNECFAKFTRAITGLIARLVLGAQRGAAKLKEGQSFWPSRPYTRVMSKTRTDYANIRAYFTLNLFESIGVDRKVFGKKAHQIGPG